MLTVHPTLLTVWRPVLTTHPANLTVRLAVLSLCPALLSVHLALLTSRPAPLTARWSPLTCWKPMLDGLGEGPNVGAEAENSFPPNRSFHTLQEVQVT